jgi:hypothetical protein
MAHPGRAAQPLSSPLSGLQQRASCELARQLMTRNGALPL